MSSNLRNLVILLALTATVLFLVFSAKPGRIVRLAGSTAFQPFAEKLADVYMETHPKISVDVQGGGSALGIMASSGKIVDIGMADMVSLPKETDFMEKVIVARDGIAVVVNIANKINDVTTSQLKDIFTGKISNWKELGGNTAPIRVISREEGSGTRKSFDKLVLGKDRLTKEAMYQDSNGTIREAVKNDPYSIGYISIGFLSGDVKALVIDGTAATNENVIAGKYKISRPIYFLLNPPVSSDTREFVNFIISVPAQIIIAGDGLIPIL